MKKLPVGSEIAQVSHNADHQFVVARVPKYSRWFVADPWCHEPMIVPFVDCCFQPTGVKSFVITTITKDDIVHPYGVDLDTGFNWNEIIEQAMDDTPIGDTEMQSSFLQKSNATTETRGDLDFRLTAIEQSSWGS